MLKSVAFTLVLVTLGVLGCGKKEEESTASKIVNYVGEEVKAKFTGRVDEIAGWYLKYDHNGLARAVQNPSSAESRAMAKKVAGQIKYLEKEWLYQKMSIKELQDVVESIDQKTAIALSLKMEYDKKHGNDISKNFIPLNHRKWFAMQLSDELEKSVNLLCYDIQEGKSQDIIRADWEKVLQAREYVINYIEGKPVIMKNETSVNGSTSKEANSDATSVNQSSKTAQVISPSSNVRPFSNGAIVGSTQSSFDNEDGYHHDAAKAIDGDIKSCWAEGVKGLGIGEFIQINFNGTYKVSGMNIWVGHQKSQDLFYKNARPVAIRIIGSDGSNEVYGLNDSMGMQRVNFRHPINVSNIKIVVDKVARGNKYEDTCIGEVSFF